MSSWFQVHDTQGIDAPGPRPYHKSSLTLFVNTLLCFVIFLCLVRCCAACVAARRRRKHISTIKRAAENAAKRRRAANDPSKSTESASPCERGEVVQGEPVVPPSAAVQGVRLQVQVEDG